MRELKEIILDNCGNKFKNFSWDYAYQSLLDSEIYFYKLGWGVVKKITPLADEIAKDRGCHKQLSIASYKKYVSDVQTSKDVVIPSEISIRKMEKSLIEDLGIDFGARELAEIMYKKGWRK